MNLWLYFPNDDGTFSLGNVETSYDGGGYIGGISGGKIEGKVPAYIYTEEKGEFKAVRFVRFIRSNMILSRKGQTCGGTK